MIDPRKITPLLSNMTVERELGRGPNGVVYLVTRRMDGKRLALKHIPVPASDAQTKALIFAGAVSSEAEAQRYYSGMVKDMKSELLLLNSLKNASGLLKVRGYQVDQKFIGVGFDVYILADYCQSLPVFLSGNPITKLQAVNLAIDLATALEQLRSGDAIHKNVKPSNIYWGDSHHFMLGDLGLVKRSELEYSAMPDQLLSPYTAPEVVPADAQLSETMDIYSVGMVLYEIYNGGILPAMENGVRTEAEFPAPAYADMALSEIILRACAFDPEDRYQDPAEMKEALILYMQRGDVSNEPLVPGTELPKDEAEVDVAAIAAAVEAGQAAEGVSFLSETPERPSEDAEKTMGEILEASQPENQDEKKPSLNELGEDDLLLPPEEEMSVEDFLASIRGTPGLEVVSMDAEGNTTTVPGYETEEDLPEGTEFVDSADTHEVPASEEPELPPADFQEQVEDTLEPEAEAVEDFSEEEPEEAPAPEPPRRPRRRPRNDDINVYDDGYADEPEDDDDDDDYEGTSPWKKVLISVIVLLVLAGGAFGLYTFKTDTVKSMTSQVLSSTSVLIQADTKNSSAMEVICSNASGEVARLPYTDGGATFTGLNPSTTYSFELKSTAGKLLLGSHQLRAETQQMTNLTGFGATDVSAVSAKLALGGTGELPEKWVVTATSGSGESVTAESTTYEILLEGLTPDTTYTATVARSDGDLLGGTTTCTFTTMGYTELTSFAQTSVTNDSMTVQWAYTGTVPETWTITCAGTDGSSTTQEVSGNECTLDGLTAGVTYTITLSCPSMRATDINTISESVSSVKITSITADQNADGDIEVSWEFTGDATPAEWSVSYAYESDTQVTPSLATTDTNSIVLENLVPDANYVIQVVSADELTVGGMTETTCVTAPAEDFTEWGCTDIELTLYSVEQNPDYADAEPGTRRASDLTTPTTSFASDEHLAFVVQVSYDVTEEEKSVSTLYVIRDEAGTPIYVYSSNRSWLGNYTTMQHCGDLPDLPQKPGAYTFEMYFDGCLLAEADFTVG